jgi:hypothetical protein
MGAGIDYGMGTTNRDLETGMRYGVISQHSVSQAWCDCAKPDYGAATCPDCGADAIAYDSNKHESFKQESGCADYACESCETSFDSSDAFGEEAIAWNYEGDGYDLTDCLDSDVFVLKSPFFTKARYCSPCVPGACSLDSPDEDGAECFCLGHDWFEDGRAPYPVYSVETRQIVEPENV